MAAVDVVSLPQGASLRFLLETEGETSRDGMLEDGTNFFNIFFFIRVAN
jgi:hypothetical protein